CIPIDPFYLTWKAREYGKNTRFIELAGEINTSMPEYVVNRIAEALNFHEKPLKGSTILILGLAYKPNVDDERESPSYKIMDLLSQRGASVEYYDPHVPVIKPTREHSHWAGKRSIPWDQERIQCFDMAVIATNHASVNYRELAAWVPTIVDSRNAMAGISVAPGQVWKA
ncbi:MAG: nucleotide sugar dehydrogenase, partial [Blastocatellia bacterium]|nr:nucleotide sugar dehydrogenase [Blastocatellia bacterium]